jgi:hypothetical protein
MLHATTTRALEQETERSEQRRSGTQNVEIRPKSKGFAVKKYTDAIQQETKLFLKNHRLGLTQTTGKSKSNPRTKKGKKIEEHSERKSQLKLRNPSGQLKDSGLHSQLKTQV